MLLKDDVVWTYRLYLDRDPESEVVIEYALKNYRNRNLFVQAVKNSEEYKKKNGTVSTAQSPFWHYSTEFDAIGVVKKYAKKLNSSSPCHATNFLGVKIRPEFFPNILTDKVGTVEDVPIPANWHADIAEWASCLRSVDLSGNQFTMMELGCGWGCWMNNLGVAAKSIGKKIKLYGIEADQEHLHFARKALNDNGITETEFNLSLGIAGKSDSTVLFPTIESGINWGGTAIFNPSKKQLNEALSSGKYTKMPVINIEYLLKNEKKLDFMHVDIQGAELDLLTEIFDLLSKKVGYIFIGTHSKQIEGGLFDLFMSNDLWHLEMERPAIVKLVNGRPKVVVDGVQAWRNTALG